jgi:hypothetical protein
MTKTTVTYLGRSSRAEGDGWTIDLRADVDGAPRPAKVTIPESALDKVGNEDDRVWHLVLAEALPTLHNRILKEPGSDEIEVTLWRSFYPIELNRFSPTALTEGQEVE